MDVIRKTKSTYGFLWTRNKNKVPLDKWHFNTVQKIIAEPIVRGNMGIDIGSGCGYDTYIMAKNNSSVKIISIDISDGVYKTYQLTSELENVRIIKCSVSDMPLKGSIFDFAYSFGVLHHMVDPQKGLLEIARILKKNSPIFLYLYEDHSENFIKYIAIKIITELRNITIKIPPRIIYVLSWLFSPLVYIIFSFPSKMLRKFKATQKFSNKIPFNFASSIFSLQGDLYDRFSAPIEHRFNKQEVYDILMESGFYNIHITRLKISAGWVSWGYKK